MIILLLFFTLVSRKGNKEEEQAYMDAMTMFQVPRYIEIVMKYAKTFVSALSIRLLVTLCKILHPAVTKVFQLSE